MVKNLILITCIEVLNKLGIDTSDVLWSHDDKQILEESINLCIKNNYKKEDFIKFYNEINKPVSERLIEENKTKDISNFLLSLEVTNVYKNVEFFCKEIQPFMYDRNQIFSPPDMVPGDHQVYQET